MEPAPLGSLSPTGTQNSSSFRRSASGTSPSRSGPDSVSHSGVSSTAQI
jgi:hypothetical protein